MTFLTIREAAEQTGHSTHKIRRLIKAVADQPNHADRSHVEPTPADVTRLTAEGVQFTWRITEELVRRELGDAPVATSAGEKPGTGVGESADVLALLQRAMAAKEQAESRLFDQLKTKDEQISGLQQTVTSLNERLRESNLLMGSLQRQLPPPNKAAAGVLNADEPQPSAVKEKRPTKSPPPAAKPTRRSWLKTIFS